VQIQAFLLILLTKNENPSTKRANQRVFAHSVDGNREIVYKTSNPGFSRHVARTPFTQPSTAEVVSHFVSRKPENQ
jgi:hypothetical protein